MDLVGGPFAVIESDPGVFTSLLRLLGIRGLEVTELYSIESWAVDHLKPRGLIFCFAYQENKRHDEPADPEAERVWFANQVIDDACASQAILNIIFNCPGVNIGQQLSEFKSETRDFPPVLRGLAISNSAHIRNAHNSLARPADLRAAHNAVVSGALDGKKKSRSATTQPPAKKRKANPVSPRRSAAKQKASEEDSGEDAFHYIAYVPAFGKVWELDGLKTGPVEVGELDTLDTFPGTECWTDVVRPALRMRMQKIGANNIRFTLLAIVDDQYEKASDELEFLRRDSRALERRLNECEPNWKNKVDPELLSTSNYTLSGPAQPSFAQDFGQRRLTRDMEILDMPEKRLVQSWESCVRESIAAKVKVEDELGKSISANVDHIKRTHDYEPFVREFISQLQGSDLLDTLLETSRKV
jgi:ubiquitin carboxyl-terminal hydrolase L5